MQFNDVSAIPFELGTWVGRRQAFGLIASKGSAAGAECLKPRKPGSRIPKTVNSTDATL
jgi:hypothetical protein